MVPKVFIKARTRKEVNCQSRFCNTQQPEHVPTWTQKKKVTTREECTYRHLPVRPGNDRISNSLTIPALSCLEDWFPPPLKKVFSGVPLNISESLVRSPIHRLHDCILTKTLSKRGRGHSCKGRTQEHINAHNTTCRSCTGEASCRCCIGSDGAL